MVCFKQQHKLPGVRRVSLAGQQLTMKVNPAVFVEESECFDFKLLEASSRIIRVLHSCISWASVGKMSHLLVKSCSHHSRRALTNHIQASKNMFYCHIHVMHLAHKLILIENNIFSARKVEGTRA